MKLIVMLAAFVAVLGHASAQTMDEAIRRGDAPALAEFRASAGPQGAIARGVLAALRGEDDPAVEMLRAAAADPRADRNVRSRAWTALASVHERRSLYNDAHTALLIAATTAGERSEAERRRDLQRRNIARVIRDVGAMRVAGAPGTLSLRYDEAGLPRVHVAIDDGGVEAVMDVSAPYSLISESSARRAHLTLLPEDVYLDTVRSRVGVASMVRLGGAQLQNVVFIVVPDSALTNSVGAFPAVIGFPVLSRLGRVEFTDAWLRFDRSGTRTWSETSNLLLHDRAPLVMIEADGAPLRMAIESKSERTTLTPLATRDYPTLIDSVSPRLTLRTGERATTVENVQIREYSVGEPHGALGQDVLRAGGGYALDFTTMRFELLP